MNARSGMVLLLMFLLPIGAFGGTAQPAVEDPALEARVMQLAEELRCLVCQNQTIADSSAGLAIDLRNQIREQLRRGATNDEIRAYMVQRYGDFVLYRPPVKASTWLLWFGPIAMLVVGCAVFAGVLVRRRREAAVVEPMSAEDGRRASALLREADGS